MKFTKLILVIALVALLVGCDSIFLPEKEVPVNVAEGIGQVNVSIDSGYRTILPYIPYGFSSLALTGENVDSGAINQYFIGGGDVYNWFDISISLPFGDWILTATFYVDIEGTEYPVAYGSIPLTVDNYEHWVDIGVNIPQSGGTGTFNYTVSYEGGQAATVRLEPWPLGQAAVINNTNVNNWGVNNVQVASGVYFLTVRGTINNQWYTRNEIVHIYDKLTTYAEYSFIVEEVLGDFHAYEWNYYNNLTSSNNYQIVNLPSEGRDYVLKVTPSSWAAALQSLEHYMNHEVRIEFSAEIKLVNSGGAYLSWQINNDPSFPSINHDGWSSVEDGVWQSMSGVWEGVLTHQDYEPSIFLPHNNVNRPDTTYYIDNLHVWVEVLSTPIDFPPAYYTWLDFDQWENGYCYEEGYSGREQWFRFTATDYTQYIHFNPGSMNDCYIEVYDATGESVPIYRTTDTWSNYRVNLYGSSLYASSYTEPYQTYYIKVWPYYSSNYGNFQIAFNSSSTPPGELIYVPPTYIDVNFYTPEENLGTYPLSKIGNTLTFSVNNPSNFNQFSWILDGEEMFEYENYSTITLNENNLTIGSHRLTIIAVTSGGIPYSQEYVFRIGQ